MNIKAAAGALILHVSVLSPWACSPVPPETETQPRGFDSPQLETKFIPMTGGGNAGCPGYKGIGVKQWGVILEVNPGSPAAEAGLEVGDNVTNSHVLGRDLYEVGHLLRLQIEKRDGSTRDVLVRVGWICEETLNPGG